MERETCLWKRLDIEDRGSDFIDSLMREVESGKLELYNIAHLLDPNKSVFFTDMDIVVGELNRFLGKNGLSLNIGESSLNNAFDLAISSSNEEPHALIEIDHPVHGKMLLADEETLESLGFELTEKFHPSPSV